MQLNYIFYIIYLYCIQLLYLHTVLLNNKNIFYFRLKHYGLIVCRWVYWATARGKARYSVSGFEL